MKRLVVFAACITSLALWMAPTGVLAKGPGSCGDGIVQYRAGERCDPPGSVCGARGNPDFMCDDFCQCVYVGFCGDGRIQWKAGEECEPYPGREKCGPGRICNPDTCICEAEADDLSPVCGDGIIDDGEECELDEDCEFRREVCVECNCVPDTGTL